MACLGTRPAIFSHDSKSILILLYIILYTNIILPRFRQTSIILLYQQMVTANSMSIIFFSLGNGAMEDNTNKNAHTSAVKLKDRRSAHSCNQCHRLCERFLRIQLLIDESKRCVGMCGSHRRARGAANCHHAGSIFTVLRTINQIWKVSIQSFQYTPPNS